MKILNKKARFEYHILETLEAGVVLSGAEVKSVRAGRVDLSESFIRVQNGELYLKNAYIYPYLGAREDYDPKKDRKLLVHKKQLNSLIGKTSKAGVTLIPLCFYTTRNLIKVEVAVAASKKKFDKRRAIKARDEQRRIEQELRGR
ncbi:MAG: SsrA-binding protein [Candidatus Daviesbacteria bacterium GW2011_GWA2_38_24]|uniref:SsrA-binding protein n=1 Tax=Candidatus Daviesbacteria bacterium GW2011_GWA2_38_24 TaxID=1618422 RepID=A0A0G0LZS1_9BACT|nr:MAG: SsrA-binding protein [Candidatus Daviesbacteria bacterium GW2011_GWA2_38_24]OGE24286.1 MAG: SsrA-binding protein [Candidatus Daviesbacteria bacterium RIFCSPHIGHO2_01_FULL_38_8]